MQFPHYLTVGRWSIHPHVFFEALAYAVGFRVYLALRRRQGDVIDSPHRWSVIAAAAAGGAIGSRVLFWFERPSVTLAHWHDVSFLLSGKTMVGGLLGGLIAVELTKKIIGLRTATGDLFAIPLCIGIAIGRIGCFLTGLSDDTYGSTTTLPWGINLGDGVLRHPVQLYESALMIMLAVVLWKFARRPHAAGDVFKLFMWSYLALRLALDFLKPEVRIFLGLSSIQWACAIGLLYYSSHLRRIFQGCTTSPEAAVREM